MLLGRQTLLNCKCIGSSCQRSIQARYRISCRGLASGNNSGSSNSCSAATAVDTSASNGHVSNHPHGKLQQQQQQQPPQPVQQQHRQAGQHVPLLHTAVRRPVQQIQYHHPAHHQPHHRQLHPKSALQAAPMQQFQIVSETPVHSRYLTVFDRKVKFCASENPNECRVLDFDVVGHPRANFCFAVTFPYHSYKDGRKGGEVTLIREYAQGPNALMYCLPTGGLDPRRHADVAECAARELSEEVCTLNQLDYSEHILT
eukprot:GHUV01036414.1.p1 GENE.GHUV01036414.1~~GHUV01036414.1.p1  ORF type:complete len:257 (+),score=49.61 GHUV01036414.1:297-1067(+)